MTRQKASVLIPLAAVLVASCTASAASAGSRIQSQRAVASTSTWEAPYAQTVNVSVGWPATTGNNTLPNGATQENNLFVDYVQKKLNVHFNWDFLASGAAYTQKVELSLASGSIPDVMQVNLQQLHQLAAAGLIQELGPTYQQNVSPYIKQFYASDKGRALGLATINGKLMALPDTQPEDQYNEVWVRQDWLTKLHLAPPKTLNDIITVARAFVKNHMGGPNTIGLMGPSGATSDNGGSALTVVNGPNGFDTVFGVYKAYPGVFYSNNGKVAYGSVEPQMKPALQLLHQLYAEGLIDPQFVSRTQADELAVVESGQCGIMFAPWWIPVWPLEPAIKNDPKADWRAYYAPVDANGKLNVVGAPRSLNFTVVRKGFAHPEVVWKVEDVDLAAMRFLDPVGDKIYQNQGVLWTNWPLVSLIDYPYTDIHVYQDIQKVIKTNNPRMLNPQEMGWYKSILAKNAHAQHPEQDVADWGNGLAMTAGVEPIADNVAQTNEIYPLPIYPTQTMTRRLAELNKLEAQTLVGIVAGQYPISQFDSFVKEWRALGGDRILQEIQQQIHS